MAPGYLASVTEALTGLQPWDDLAAQALPRAADSRQVRATSAPRSAGTAGAAGVSGPEAWTGDRSRESGGSPAETRCHNQAGAGGRDPKGTWGGCAGGTAAGARSGKGRRALTQLGGVCLSPRPRFRPLDWRLPRAASAPSCLDRSHTDSQVHMEPRVIKILGPRRPLACIPGVAPDWVLASSSRSSASRDPVAKGRGVPYGPSGGGLKPGVFRFLRHDFPGCSDISDPALPSLLLLARSAPYFLREALCQLYLRPGPVSSRRLRGARVQQI